MTAHPIRVNQLIDDIADHWRDASDRLLELVSELGVPAPEVFEMLAQRMPPPHPEILSAVKIAVQQMVADGIEPPSTIRGAIMRAFATHGTKVGDTDTAAIEGVVIWVRGTAHPVQGVLTSVNGILKLGTAQQDPKTRETYLIDTFFAYEDVVMFALQNKITAERSSIIQQH